MKCPVCAETIQDEATKCRFCGQVLTKAVRLGWPDFYHDCAGLGYLDPESLLGDYEEHLGLDFSDSCLAVIDPIGRAVDYADPATFADEIVRIDAVLEAFKRRLDQLQDGVPEGIFLLVMSVYLRTLRKYVHDDLSPQMIDDPKSLKASADSIRRLDDRLSMLDPQSQGALRSFLDNGTSSLLGRAGLNT